MHILGTIVVRPVLPQRIAGLQELSRNLWWCWNANATRLFVSLDSALWESVGHNPIALLASISQSSLEKAAADKEYLDRYDSVMGEFKAYMNPTTTRFTSSFPQHANKILAYFSAEFGIHESLPIYSGGLGILSGDHMKTASDLGIPMIGVGLMYSCGYFLQSINGDGWQESNYNRMDFSNAPVEKALDPEGHEIVVQVDMPDRIVHARVWLARVGRIKLYLLDTDIEQNALDDRSLSAKLYGGDNHMRIAQEKILGIGGVKAIRCLGLNPSVWHMNEGHSAFLTIELMRELVNKGLTWQEAIEALSPSVCFTTHTPVPAGQDSFDANLIELHFWNLRSQLGMSRHEFMRLGQNPNQPDSNFNLTVLALKLSKYRNGVSKLHGAVSRELWRATWPELGRAEIPIASITNGVHTGSWIAPELAELFDKYAGSRWRINPDDVNLWKNATVPADELWSTHQKLKRDMIGMARQCTRKRFQRNGFPTATLQEVDKWLEPEVLTIGFARRFATYKRAVLLFSDLERVKKIMFQPGRQVNFVFAGKAHPADRPGQEFIKRIHDISLMPEFRGHVILLEDYDIAMARFLVHGVDVWLNNPRRPLEASGTSGEKAAMNGVLNFSVLDGWWAEGFNGKNGWAIGEEREYATQNEQDSIDANSLYSTLEEQIVPLYYSRDEHNVPTGWTTMMMESIRSLLPTYSTHRMLHDYCHDMYMPAVDSGDAAQDDNYHQARSLASWKSYIESTWGEVNLEAEFQQIREVKRGQMLSFHVRAYLGKLKPEDIKVELYAGHLVKGDISAPVKAELSYCGFRDGAHRYEGEMAPQETGSFAYAVRAIPIHPAGDKEARPFVRWAR